MAVFFGAALWGFSPARAENLTFIAFGCESRVNRTLHIQIGAPDVLIKISIWTKELENLERGERTIVIINDVAGLSTMTGTEIEGAPNNKVDLTVHFNGLDLKVGGKAFGYIQEPNSVMKIPFQGVIAATAGCD